MAKVLNCVLKVSKFKHQLCYCIPFEINTLGGGINPLLSPVMDYIISLMFFYKDGFGIKLPMKVDMPLKQRNQT